MWARQCIPCQKSKIHKHNHFTPIHIPIPENRFLHIHIDIIKLPNINGYPYCLTIIDRFTRWPEAIPLKDISSDTIVQALFSNWIPRFGTPCVITSDQGCQFESAIFKSLTDTIGAKKIRTTAYHPQSNGLVERWHKTLKAALMCSPELWIKVLPVVLLGLRSSYKEDLKASSAEMVYKTTLRLPGEISHLKNCHLIHKHFWTVIEK
ncbi:protein NYNRIN-like [Ctenocephalides felis]|uniref:protein NYNRIN-like n=1 Tax=Ctenocephalides felis TaxID=7515 RepID=UPI000E6E2025|nr:protein NYNRIN-like [Ctenocephalides felis]